MKNILKELERTQQKNNIKTGFIFRISANIIKLSSSTSHSQKLIKRGHGCFKMFSDNSNWNFEADDIAAS